MQQGGDFLSGFASRVLGSWAGSAFQLTSIGQTKRGVLAFSGLSKDLGAELAGGDFWKGAATGLTIAGLNHAAHSIFEDSNHMFASKEEAMPICIKVHIREAKPIKNISYMN